MLHARQVIDGVPEILDKLRKAGKKMFFVTNNSTKSRKVGAKGKDSSETKESVIPRLPD